MYVVEVLSRSEWTARADAHRARLAPYVEPHLARRGARIKHPVNDFLFTYYSYRPAQLLRWHPGFGVTLSDAPEYADLRGYSNGTVSTDFLADKRLLVETLLKLLRATAGRDAHFGCFGLHEWAMVYQLTPEQVRHADWPLRLGTAGTDRVVESHRIACSHFDAYRFFTPPALPLNTLSPRSDDRAAFEQPGCLHGNMDLYGKVGVRLMPLICSDLLADAFELAWDIRALDMQAAPYDLSDLDEGWTPVKIETAEGKREYADLQRQLAERAAPIRAALIDECERLIAELPSAS
ncbi:3-methyladenine DNA glycosylase [Nocardioides sp. KC13]|uniref:3-methyladenine DNA glycosylase n=1 Tax=Nocardioides turkmenicus TaxID=2711220 RepID=A0A6M1R4A0_9ACTN|nr:3-methyladenine DNA glycosylase [Nocardioides sp. KC13]NGN92518.1 3-methyladenine DNA glycosylase [Nocardioides sp. KC13]